MKPPLFIQKHGREDTFHSIEEKKTIGYLRSHVRLLFQQYKFFPCKFNNLNKFTDVSCTVVFSFLLGKHYCLLPRVPRQCLYLHLQQQL